MRNWLEMNAGCFAGTGIQLNLLAGLEGDAYGTADLFEFAAQAPTSDPVRVMPWPSEPALFGAEQLVLSA